MKILHKYHRFRFKKFTNDKFRPIPKSNAGGKIINTLQATRIFKYKNKK